MQLDDTAHILGNAEFFSICNLEQRRMLAFASERIRLAKGQTLFRAGEVISGAYVLISGELVSVPGEGEKGEPVAISRPGTVIGELALLTEHPRRATIVCQQDAELLMVPRSAFGKLMEQFPDVARRAGEVIRTGMGQYVGMLRAVQPRLKSGG